MYSLITPNCHSICIFKDFLGFIWIELKSQYPNSIFIFLFNLILIIDKVYVNLLRTFVLRFKKDRIFFFLNVDPYSNEFVYFAFENGVYSFDAYAFG